MPRRAITKISGRLIATRKSSRVLASKFPELLYVISNLNCTLNKPAPVVQAPHPLDVCVQQEVGEPPRSTGASLRLLQFLPRSSQHQDDARDGCRNHGPGMEHQRSNNVAVLALSCRLHRLEMNRKRRCFMPSSPSRHSVIIAVIAKL